MRLRKTLIVITSSKGESITFQLAPEAEHLMKKPIHQVCYTGSMYQTVSAGYNSGDSLQCNGFKWTQTFNMANDYLFQFNNQNPLKVVVKVKPMTQIFINDDGFSKPMIR